jgi:hypothetical protein
MPAEEGEEREEGWGITELDSGKNGLPSSISSFSSFDGAIL